MPLTLRATRFDVDLLEKVAEITGKSVTDLVLEAIRSSYKEYTVFLQPFDSSYPDKKNEGK